MTRTNQKLITTQNYELQSLHHKDSQPVIENRNCRQLRCSFGPGEWRDGPAAQLKKSNHVNSYGRELNRKNCLPNF